MNVVVLISADAEWRAVRQLLQVGEIELTPFGECFRHDLIIQDRECNLILMQGGWGKIAAAASTQYAIDHWRPKMLVNLGTCGGIAGEIERGEIVLADRTLVYDIFEQMGDPESHIAYYSTKIDLAWLEKPYPTKVRRGLLISGDRDLAPDEIKELKRRYGAIAGDWESGSIAFVAQRNDTPCLILRGVSDIVSEQGGEAYGDVSVFEESAKEIMEELLNLLPEWIEKSTPVN
ncbi:MAG: 5'-methylthioadenosine/S-adenosylhomocysteine nucleosidase [Anaerolineales bacterium]